MEVVSELLRERLGPTTEYTQSLIEIQTSYINTNHPAFISGSAAAAAAQAASTAPSKYSAPSRVSVSSFFPYRLSNHCSFSLLGLTSLN